MPSTDTKPELTAKASMAQPVSQPAVYANGLKEERQRERMNGAMKDLRIFEIQNWWIVARDREIHGIKFYW
jgi:hypothetical protein